MQEVTDRPASLDPSLTLAGRGEPGFDPAPRVLWSIRDIAEGAGAVAWLIADLDGDRSDELLQAWNNDGKLAFIVYRWDGDAITQRWASSDMGQGVDAVAWLVGDVNGDGKAEILQLWDHDGALGIIVYGWNRGIDTLFVTGDAGQGAGAVDWLLGDLDGDGRAELVQQWSHDGTLASVVYGFRGNGLQTLFSGDLGQGPGALAWLVGDVNGDGKAEIVQPWNNDGGLGTIVYGWNGSAIVQLWGSGNLGQGSGALAWLIADLDGRGKADVIQEWDSSGQVSTLVYGWNGGAMVELFNVNMSEGTGSIAWLTGRIIGDRRSQILQLWSNGGALAMILYGIPPA